MKVVSSLILLFVIVFVARANDLIVIRVKGNKIVAKALKDDFISIGDQYLLKNNQGACIFRIIKEKNQKALMSSDGCGIAAKKGNKLTYIFIRKKASRKIASENKEATEDEGAYTKPYFSLTNFPLFFEFSGGIGVKFPSPSEQKVEDIVIDSNPDLQYKNLTIKSNSSLNLHAFMQLSSSMRREITLSLLFDEYRQTHERTGEIIEQSVGNINTKIESKKSVGVVAFSAQISPIIPKMRIRPLLGYASFDGSVKNEVNESFTISDINRNTEETIKVDIDGHSVVYGAHIDLDSRKRDTYIQAYINNITIKGDNEKERLTLYGLVFSKEMGLSNHSLFSMAFSIDHDEFKNWDIGVGYRFKNIKFSLGYSQKSDKNLNGKDFTQKNIGFDISYYFGSNLF